MTEGFELVVEALGKHTRSLGEVTEQLSTAHGTVSEPLPPDAYGTSCADLAARLRELSLKGLDTVAAGVRSTEQLTDLIMRTAEDYQAMDDEAADSLDKIDDD